MSIQQTLRQMFARCVEEHRLFFSLHTLRGDIESAVFMEFADAERWILERMDTRDIYWGCGLLRVRPRKGRGTWKDVAAIPGLWADIDVREGRADCEKAYCSTIDEAISLAQQLAPPSLIVHTGGGLHCYWLFREPWVFDSADEQIEASGLSAYWQNTLQYVASTRGRQIDKTADLSRVLRVPGTWNHKFTPPVQVTILDCTDNVYNPTDLREIAEAINPGVLKDLQRSVTKEGATVTDDDTVENICVAENAQPPSEKFAALYANSQEFQNLWNHNKKDLPDQSPSGYDYHIALACALAGWTAQEIADTLIAFRRNHNLEPEKALRRDYVALTVQKAISKTAEARAETWLTSWVDGQASSGDVPADDLEKVRMQLQKAIGIPVHHLLQHGREGAQYTLVLTNGTQIPVGSAIAINQLRLFRCPIMDATGHVIRDIKNKTWLKIVAAMMRLVAVEDDPSYHQTERVRMLVLDYLSSNPVFSGEKISSALLEFGPFQKNGCIWLSSQDLRQWIAGKTGERWVPNTLHAELHKIGFRIKHFSVRFGDVVNNDDTRFLADRTGSGVTSRLYHGIERVRIEQMGLVLPEVTQSNREAENDDIII